MNAVAEPRRAALVFVFITVVLDMLALGVIIPVLPKLVVRMAGGDTATGAEVYGLFGTTWALMHFLAAPLLGALSDRFGRRPVLLLSSLGLALDYALMGWAPTLGWLLVGRLISGATSASVATAGAYIADVLPAESRAKGFGFLGMAFGIGFVLGPAIGGLLGTANPRLPFWVSSALCFANTLYGFFVLPESLPRERRAAFEWKRANPVGALVLLRSYPSLLGLASVSFLGQLAHVSLQSTFVLYASYRYAWNEREVGLAMAAVGIASVAVQGGLVSRAVRRFGERTTLAVGQLSGALGFLIYGWAPSGPLFFLGVPFMALWGLSNPSVQGLMTKLVSPREQGRLQGANASLVGIAQLLGPGLFSQVFAHSIAKPALGREAADFRELGSGPLQLPGAAFFVSALLLMLALGIGRQVTRKSPRTEPPVAVS